jgi:5-methylcytosine-specific restriction endonuclease McrA
MSRHHRAPGAGIPRPWRRAILSAAYSCDGCRSTVAPGHCSLCHRPGADTIDHVVPLSRGGRTELGNLAPAHGWCNARKQATGQAREAPTIVRPW